MKRLAMLVVLVCFGLFALGCEQEVNKPKKPGTQPGIEKKEGGDKVKVGDEKVTEPAKDVVPAPKDDMPKPPESPKAPDKSVEKKTTDGDVIPPPAKKSDSK